MDGTLAYKLKVVLKEGDLDHIYLDPDHYLEIRIVSYRKVRGVEGVEETDLSNYERVAGVYFPFAIESGAKGGPKGAKISIEKAEANLPVGDQVFEFPTGGSK